MWEFITENIGLLILLLFGYSLIGFLFTGVLVLLFSETNDSPAPLLFGLFWPILIPLLPFAVPIVFCVVGYEAAWKCKEKYKEWKECS